MPDERSPRALLDELARSPHGDDLARLTRQIADKVVASRRRDLPAAAAPLTRGSALAKADVQTSYGDPLAALERGPRDRAERLLLGALLARGVQLSPPAGVEAEDRVAGELLWLAAHADLDAFPALDAALGERAAGLWGALCDLIRRIDGGREANFDRAEALVGASALRSASGVEARAAASKLADEVEDPLLRELLRGEGAGPAPVADQAGAGGETTLIRGELEPAPRSPLVTVLMAVSGLLLVVGGARLVARLALARKHPAELEVSREGIRIRTRTEMLGKVLQEAEHLVPAGGLVRASRQVRFPSLGLYVGLLALALGSYLGVSLVGYGVQAASPSLLGQGLLLVALGVGIELGVTALFPGSKGQCSVVLVPRKGAALCVGGLDIEAAQRTLSRLSHR